MAEELKPLDQTLEQDLQNSAEKVKKQLAKSILNDEELKEYYVGGTEEEWKNALKKGVNGLVSIPVSKKRDGDDAATKSAGGKKFKKGKKSHKKH